MKLHVVIDNVYPDDTITTEHDLDVDPPTPQDAADNYEAWAYEKIFPHTGTGRERGEAGYFARITSVETEYRRLLDHDFEWGT